MDRRSTRVLRYTRVLAALGSVVAGILRSLFRLRWFLALVACHVAAAPGKRKNAARFCVIPVFCPRWALSWPESCIVVPATAGFWPWLLAAGPPRWHPSRPGKRKNARRSTIYARFCFLSSVSLGRAVPAPTGEALKARDRRAIPAAAPRRFIHRTEVQSPGAAAAPRLDSPPGAPFTGLGLAFFAWRKRCALSRPESCIVVPATLVCGLGCLPRGPPRRRPRKRRRVEGAGSLLLLLRLLVLGFSWGAAGCSAGCLALCWFLGCWLLWWVVCCSCGYTLEHRMTHWISEKNQD